MFSVTNTGMKSLPLCTCSVWPIISGVIIERRDQVRMIWRLPDWALRSTFLASDAWTYGPFLTERAITSALGGAR